MAFGCRLYKKANKPILNQSNPYLEPNIYRQNTISMQRISLSILSLFLLVVTVQGQRPDSTRRLPGGPGGGNGSGPKPYREVITSKAVSDQGLFTVHKLDDKYFVEIPDSIIGRDLLVVNRISKASAGMRTQGSFFGYGGDQIGQNVIRFERDPITKSFSGYFLCRICQRLSS
jgi:hypothetical protein